MDFIDALIENGFAVPFTHEEHFHGGHWRLYRRPDEMVGSEVYSGFSSWETCEIWKLLLWVKESEDLHFPDEAPQGAMWLQAAVLDLIEDGARAGLFPNFRDFVALIYAYGGCDFDELWRRTRTAFWGDGDAPKA